MRHKILPGSEIVKQICFPNKCYDLLQNASFY